MEWKDITRIEGFDYNYAMNIFQDEEILKIILGDFYESLEEWCGKLNGLLDALDAGDNLSLYRTEVHALKSVSASVGALGLSGRAADLEKMAIDKDVAGIKKMHPLLIEDIAIHKKRLEESIA